MFARRRGDVKRAYDHGPRLHFDGLAGPGSFIGGFAADLERGICGRHLLDLTREPEGNALDLLERRADVAGGDDPAFGIQGIRFRAERNRELVSLGRVEHPAAELGRFAERNRKDSARQRVERSAVADLRPGLARLTEQALDRADGLGRAEAHRLVEDDPAVEHQPARPKIPRNARAIAPTTGETTRSTTFALGEIAGRTRSRTTSTKSE